MKLQSLFKYPAYLYNPKQVFIRLRRQFTRPSDNEIVCLPWGHPLAISPKDFIGQAIWSQGIHELNVCETIARLVHGGDTVVDVGANVGFMTSLMAKTVGKTGHVLAFEPHPELYSRLRANIGRFSDSHSACVTAEPVALSDCEGEDWLVFDSELFARNSGTAGLCGSSFASGKARLRVRKSRLDPFIENKVVTLLKIDVEGAELRVLFGVESALTERRIMNIVYEDFHSATSGIASYLRGFGFSVFYLDGNIIRPTIRDVTMRAGPVLRGREENFIAVLDAQVFRRAYRGLGWRVFGL